MCHISIHPYPFVLNQINPLRREIKKFAQQGACLGQESTRAGEEDFFWRNNRMVLLPEGVNGVANHLAQRLKAGRDLLHRFFRSRRDGNVAPVDGEGSNEDNASFQVEDHGTPLLADVQEDAMVRNSFTG